MTFIHSPSKVLPPSPEYSGIESNFSEFGEGISQKANFLREDLNSSEDPTKTLDLKDINRRVVAVIQERPWTVIGLSFLAGVLLGYKVVKR